MAYIAFDTHFAHSTPEPRRAPVALYGLLGCATAALAFAGWGFWMINDVVPGAVQGMVMVLAGA